jgi:hypothetical protein
MIARKKTGQKDLFFANMQKMINTVFANYFQKTLYQDMNRIYHKTFQKLKTI